MKKISSGMFLTLALLVIAGCGNKNASQNPNTAGQKETGKAVEKSTPKNLPAATGDVDATVDAIVNGSEDEAAQVVSDTDSAKEAVSDAAESVNLSNIYDQNEF